MHDITPAYEFNPPVTFVNPITVTMRTCISAPAGKKILTTLLTRDYPEEEWKETKQLILEQINQIVFVIHRCGGIKLAADCSGAVLHLINGFHIHLATGMIAVTLSKHQTDHDSVRKSLHGNGYVNFSVISHDVQANFGSKISISLKPREPKDITISEALPTPTFTLNEDFLLKGKQIAYFEFEPEPSDQCRMISMLFEYKIDGALEQRLPLRVKLPRKEPETLETDHQEIEKEEEESRNTRSNLFSRFKRLWR